MASILESLRGVLGPQVVNGVSSQLNEPTSAVQRGLEESSAAQLAGIGSKADQPGFMQQIFSFIKSPANDLAFAGVPAAAAAGGLGSQFLSTVFGSNQGAVADGIARETGMTSGKATALLGRAPVVATMPAAVAQEAAKPRRWVWPVLGLIALALIAFWIFHRAPSIPSIDTS